MPSVSLADAEGPLVLALDLGTSSFRAMVFDRQARLVPESEAQLEHAIRSTPDGGAEADAPALFHELVRCIDQSLQRVGDRAEEIAAVGVSCFWHSVMGMDADGQPLTPVLIWADSRSRAQVDALRREHDPEDIHERTGCFVHSSYWPGKLRWLRETQPSVWRSIKSWGSFAEYAARRLHGEGPCSIAMASGTGLLEVHTCDWYEPLLTALEVEPRQLPTLMDRDQPLPGLRSEWAKRWPILARVPWFPAIGDGAAANLGSGATGEDRIALTLGTSGAMRIIRKADRVPVPPGIWAYRLDRNRYVLGGALSNGGNVLAWLASLLQVDFNGADLDRAGDLQPDAHGLTILPFIAGERSPSWNDHARGVLAGLTIATERPDLLRAGMESVAYRFARIAERLRPLAESNATVVANGGAILRSPAWLQLTADTLDKSVLALPPDDEASARGAAIVALAGAGVIPDIVAAPDPAASDETHRYDPDPDRHEMYRRAVARQRAFEDLLFPNGGAWDYDWARASSL